MESNCSLLVVRRTRRRRDQYDTYDRRSNTTIHMIAVIITVIAVLAPILTHGLELNARLVSSSSSDGDGDSTDESISIPPDSAAAAVAAHTHTPHATTTPPSHTNTLNPVPKKSDTIDRRGFDEESSSSPDADGVELSIHHAADDDDHTSSSESTHCKGVGFCTECRSDEAGATYCSHNNAKELIECRVIATTTMTTNRTRTNLYEQSHIPNEGAERVIRTFTHFAPCENDGRYGPNSFWAFEFVCLLGVCGSLWLMLKRRRIVLSQHHRRLDHLANS